MSEERELGLKVAVDTAMTAWLKAASAMSGWGIRWSRGRKPLLREAGPFIPDGIWPGVE